MITIHRKNIHSYDQNLEDTIAGWKYHYCIQDTIVLEVVSNVDNLLVEFTQ